MGSHIILGWKLQYTFRELQHLCQLTYHLLQTSTMLITNLPVDIKIQIITCLGSWRTVKVFLEALPSMTPLLGAYSSSIAKSIPKLPYKQKRLERFMGAILEAHFSKPLRTADEMRYFMNYHFPDQQNPSRISPLSLRRPVFPRDIESIDYMMAVRLALEYFGRCMQIEYPTASTSGKTAWVPPDFLLLQLHVELFHPTAGENDNLNFPEMVEIFWSKFSQRDKESCKHIYTTILWSIQLLHYDLRERDIGRKFFQFPDAPSQPRQIPRLEVLCSHHRSRPYIWHWESNDGGFVCRQGLYDDEIDAYGERELAIVDNMYRWWYETEYMDKFFENISY